MHRVRTSSIARRDYLVVMTGCIDPSSTRSQGVRSDPLVRLEDYASSLRFWLSLADARLRQILFIENSAYPLARLEKIVAEENPSNKHVEFVSMMGEPCPEGVSYGYRELAALDEGLTKSAIARDSKYLIKVTGRLTFPGISALLDRLPDDFEFAVDSRNNTHFVPFPQRFVTTQLMIFRNSFYERELRGIKSRLSPQVPLIEGVLFDLLMPYRGKPGAILRWPVNCDPRGQAAHWQKDYGSPRQRLLNLLRAASRRVLPNWWC